jgi:hypothetical protein
LAFTHRFNEVAFDVDRCAGSDGLELFVVELVHIKNDLNVVHGRAIVEGNELYVFVASASAYPSFDRDLRADEFGFEEVDYFGSFHIRELTVVIKLSTPPPDDEATRSGVIISKLLERTHLEEVDFFLSKVAPASAGQVLFGQACEVNAVEFCDVVTERFEDTTYDTVAS